MPTIDMSGHEGARWRPASDEERTIYRGVVGWVCVNVTLRRVVDGVERVHVDNTGFPVRDDEVDWGPDGARYWWTEGNGACDCNREVFFAKAGGEEAEAPEHCSDDRYVIVAPDWLADVLDN